MNKKMVEDYFMDKENVRCPLTEKLIRAGYKQTSGGYILNAKKAGIKDPSQYWHLISSWCALSEDDAPFNKTIQCGELIIWMAECSGAVSNAELSDLVDTVTRDYLTDRRNGNRLIQAVCFDRIVEMVTRQAA